MSVDTITSAQAKSLAELRPLGVWHHAGTRRIVAQRKTGRFVTLAPTGEMLPARYDSSASVVAAGFQLLDWRRVRTADGPLLAPPEPTDDRSAQTSREVVAEVMRRQGIGLGTPAAHEAAEAPTEPTPEPTPLPDGWRWSVWQKPHGARNTKHHLVWWRGDKVTRRLTRCSYKSGGAGTWVDLGEPADLNETITDERYCQYCQRKPKETSMATTAAEPTSEPTGEFRLTEAPRLVGDVWLNPPSSTIATIPIPPSYRKLAEVTRVLIEHYKEKITDGQAPGPDVLLHLLSLSGALGAIDALEADGGH